MERHIGRFRSRTPRLKAEEYANRTFDQKGLKPSYFIIEI